MASNYRNSAGTDLDDVFYVNNSNAGALGFRLSDGQDLGNRYPVGSLGYNVGYKNSAGTDIGYLRTKLVAPTATISVATSNLNKKAKTVSCGRWEESNYISAVGFGAYGVFTPSITVTNGMSVASVQWYFQGYDTNGTWPYYVYMKFNSTTIPDSYIGGTCDYGQTIVVSGYDSSFTLRNGTNVSSAATSNLLGTTTSLSTNISFKLLSEKETSSGGRPYGVGYLRVRAYVSNSAGGNWVDSPFIEVYQYS